MLAGIGLYGIGVALKFRLTFPCNKFGTMAYALKLFRRIQFLNQPSCGRQDTKTKCMKAIFTLFTSLLLSVALFAADAKPKSMLIVKSTDAGDVRVVLDGRRFESNTNMVTIQDLDAGNHTIKVYRQKNNGLFTIFNKRYEVVYNTSLKVKPGTSISITIDRFGRTSMQESKIFRGRQGRGWENDYDRGNDHIFDYDQDGKFGDYDNNYGYSKGMNDREFSQVLQSISKEWLETNKLKSATQIVKSNSLTSAQVKQLVLLFNFESNKLELAKQAYPGTVDKKNYFMINDVFSFNSSREDLARFIRSSQ
jgi:hypothetical protein